jgi:ABC-type glycerol-3-phosphate transport system substrate-binding protein
MNTDRQRSQLSSSRHNRRQFLGRAGALAGASLIGGRANAGASGRPENRAQAVYAAQDQIEITIWTAFPELDTFLTEIGPTYTEVKPNVKIVNTLFPQRALEEKVAASLPAGEGPDLIEMDRHEILPYYQNGEILPFEGEIADYLSKDDVLQQGHVRGGRHQQSTRNGGRNDGDGREADDP